jgi:tetratricopeptide (TPR) repeat protein
VNALACAIVSQAIGCSVMRDWLHRPEVESQRLMTEAQQAETQGNLTSAESLCRQAMDVEPDCIEAQRMLAFVLLERGDDKAALTQFQRLVDINPEDAESWIRIAHLREQQGENAAARTAVANALAANPKYIDALLFSAQHQREINDDQGALDALHRVLSIDADNIEAKLGIATLQIDSNRSERAAPLLRTICESPLANPVQKAEAYWALGMVYGKKRRWSDAASAINKAFEHPKRPSADQMYRLAYAQFQANERQQAWQAARVALQLSARHAGAAQLTAALSTEFDDSARRVVPVGYSNTVLPVPTGWSR